MLGMALRAVGYGAASVGVQLDVDHSLSRRLLTFVFYFIHQFFSWVLGRALLGSDSA